MFWVLFGTGALAYLNIGYAWGKHCRKMVDNWGNEPKAVQLLSFPMETVTDGGFVEPAAMVMREKPYLFCMSLFWPLKVAWCLPVHIGYGFYRGILGLMEFGFQNIFLFPYKLPGKIKGWVGKRREAAKLKEAERETKLIEEHQSDELQEELGELGDEIGARENELIVLKLRKGEVEAQLETGYREPAKIAGQARDR